MFVTGVVLLLLLLFLFFFMLLSEVIVMGKELNRTRQELTRVGSQLNALVTRLQSQRYDLSDLIPQERIAK